MHKSKVLSCAAWLLSLTLMGHTASAAVVTIYEDTLTGSGEELHGTSVEYSTDQYGSTLDATWYSPIPNRTARTANGATLEAYTGAYLPITIERGLVYQVTATINKTAGNQQWVALGFLSVGPSDPGLGRALINDASDHKSSAAVRVYSPVNATVGPPEFFAGPGATNQVTAGRLDQCHAR